MIWHRNVCVYARLWTIFLLNAKDRTYAQFSIQAKSFFFSFIPKAAWKCLKWPIFSVSHSHIQYGFNFIKFLRSLSLSLSLLIFKFVSVVFSRGFLGCFCSLRWKKFCYIFFPVTHRRTERKELSSTKSEVAVKTKDLILYFFRFFIFFSLYFANMFILLTKYGVEMCTLAVQFCAFSALEVIKSKALHQIIKRLKLYNNRKIVKEILKKASLLFLIIFIEFFRYIVSRNTFHSLTERLHCGKPNSFCIFKVNNSISFYSFSHSW